ncbi:uncharacterized protein LOC120092205 [Benincasa hispida]|uniref:uncharacterized protein LOC120092205 n=1 Tax=Benincasa hispida TaxID=102211 RepID=UPI0019002659|nr:uncharacterized protein LOC120092205 [Benincasa hispida]
MLTGATRFASMAAAGIGVIRSRLRKAPPVQASDQLLCNSTRPVSALTSSSSPTAKAVVAEENDLIMEAGEPVTRLVFGGRPNVEESKEATADLKEVLDAMFLSSSKSFESETSLLPGISLPLNTEMVDNRSGLIIEKNTSTPGPEHVHEAFRLLCYSSTIQNIVASLASDQKVYEAVLENSELKKYINAYETSSGTFEHEGNVESKASAIEKLRNLKDFVVKMVINIPNHLPGLFGFSAVESGSESDDKQNSTMEAGKFGSGFVEKLKKLKNSVVEMATNIPNYLPNFHGSPASENVSGSEHKGNTQSFPPEVNLGTYLTGLAIMVIMIVVFKRVS